MSANRNEFAQSCPCVARMALSDQLGELERIELPDNIVIVCLSKRLPRAAVGVLVVDKHSEPV